MKGVRDADGWWIIPIDYIEGWNEMTDAERLAHYHRGKAMDKLSESIPDLYEL